MNNTRSSTLEAAKNRLLQNFAEFLTLPRISRRSASGTLKLEKLRRTVAKIVIIASLFFIFNLIASYYICFVIFTEMFLKFSFRHFVWEFLRFGPSLSLVKF